MNKSLQQKNTFRIDADAREIQVYEGNMENYEATAEVLSIISASHSFSEKNPGSSQTDIHYRFSDNEKLQLADNLLTEIGFTRIS